MKSKLIRSDKAKETASEYPALYKSTTSELVVLAIGQNAGTVVVTGIDKEAYLVGEYSYDWADFSNTSEWRRLPLDEKVVLEND